MQSTQTGVPLIHYIWVGPPNQSGIGVPGHDVIGPLSMAKSNHKNPIMFWCLADHVDYYKEKFKDYPITVSAIELHLSEYDEIPEFKHAADQVIDILSTCLAEERNSIRDRVTVKEIFSLFLLYTLGGYTLDTNIVPNKEQIELPSYPTFRIPAFTENPMDPRDFDFWMMYSPLKENRELKEMINEFYDNWSEAERYFKEKGGNVVYYDLAAASMPIITTFAKGNMQIWLVPDINHNAVNVEELGLVKYYSNTHRFQFRKMYNPSLFSRPLGKGRVVSEILSAAQAFDTTWLKLLISHGADVNTRVPKTTPYSVKNETPLHLAVSANNVEGAILLLEAGANPDLVAIYPGNIKLSARDLMHDKSEFSEVIKMIPNKDNVSHASENEEYASAEVLAFRMVIENDLKAALFLLDKIPNDQLTKFLRSANLDIPQGEALINYAIENNNGNLIISLAQISGVYFGEERKEYHGALLESIYLLKDYQLYHEPFLREAIIFNPNHGKALVLKTLVLQDLGLLSDEIINKVLVKHPDAALQLVTAIIELKEQEVSHENLFQTILMHPHHASDLASLAIKLADAHKLDVLPMLIEGDNIGERINIGFLLNECNLLDSVGDIISYQLLEPENTERLIEALDCTRMKRLASEDEFKEDLEGEFDDQEDFEQLIQSYARRPSNM